MDVEAEAEVFPFVCNACACANNGVVVDAWNCVLGRLVGRSASCYGRMLRPKEIVCRMSKFVGVGLARGDEGIAWE
jgi:hypothetical protein